MTDELQQFIGAYGDDLATGDGRRIARSYDTHVVFVSDAAASATPNDDGFADWFSAASATYRERGFGDPKGEATRVEALSDGMLLAWVTGHYRDTAGEPMFDADYVSGLRRDDSGFRIASVWSLNEVQRAAEYIASRGAA